MSDLRIRYTKAFIKKAFIDLLKAYPIKKITVKAICEKAEINRSTFYKYYNDVYDLFDKLEGQYLHQFYSKLTSPQNRSLENILELVAEEFRSDGDAIIIIFDECINPAGKRKLFDTCYSFFAGLSPCVPLGGGGG